MSENKREKPGRSSRRRALLHVLLLLFAMFTLAFVFEYTRPYRFDNPVDAYVDKLIGRGWVDFEDPNLTYVEMPSDADSTGMLTVSDERGEYNGGLILILPRLQLYTEVSGGTTLDSLHGHPGLFEMSDMPGEGDRNVSIAGHRDHSSFYYLDRVGEGDRAYLVYKGKIYTYVFHDRTEVLPSEWSIIGKQGYSCCTLITCTPIRTATHRMVVRFELESVEESTDARLAEIADWR